VLVATDGSDESAAAIDLIADWPIFADIPVRVLSVTPVESTDGPAGATPDADRRRIVEAATAMLVAAGRTALPVVRSGDAVAEIVAEARPDELIVIGSRGRTGLTRALLGSVARGVLLSTETSVLIVRRDPAPADRTS
jgi:nucleotide-binding universal stress UspA family protein